MFTKTIKKYMALGLVLAFCSASSMAADYEKTLTPGQYQPYFSGYGITGGVAVTGTTVPGCPAPVLMGFAPVNADADVPLAPLLGVTHAQAQVMDLITKAKVAGKSIKVYYSGGTNVGNGCNLTAAFML